MDVHLNYGLLSIPCIVLLPCLSGGPISFTRSPVHEWFSRRCSLRRAECLKRQSRTGTAQSENRQKRHGRRSTVNL